MPPGRRPGRNDTRADIVEAARACFVADGYDHTSIRAVARQAGVDPALVHHYFGGKPALFVEVLHGARDPGDPLHHDVQPTTPGGFAVLGFLSMWEPRAVGATERFHHDDSPVNRFCTAMQAVTASPAIADALREFLAARVWNNIPHLPDEDDAAWELRRATVASILVGMGFQRYVMRLEPLASATPAQLVAWFGPHLTTAATGPLPQDPTRAPHECA